MSVKLWHDDVRPAPDDSWTWARTNNAAKAVLNARPVDEISLDHDLGYDGPPPDSADSSVFLIKGWSEETGYDLACWMVEHGKVPPKVTIHSWNPSGAQRMAAAFRQAGHHCAVVPYDLRTFDTRTQTLIKRDFGSGSA